MYIDIIIRINSYNGHKLFFKLIQICYLEVCVIQSKNILKCIAILFKYLYIIFDLPFLFRTREDCLRDLRRCSGASVNLHEDLDRGPSPCMSTMYSCFLSSWLCDGLSSFPAFPSPEASMMKSSTS